MDRYIDDDAYRKKKNIDASIVLLKDIKSDRLVKNVETKWNKNLKYVDR